MLINISIHDSVKNNSSHNISNKKINTCNVLAFIQMRTSDNK